MTDNDPFEITGALDLSTDEGRALMAQLEAGIMIGEYRQRQWKRSLLERIIDAIRNRA